MKRDKTLQLSILRQIEADSNPMTRFERFSRNYGGYDDTNTPDWSDEQAYNIRLLIRDGYLRSDRVSDAPWLGTGSNDEDPYAETYIGLTSAGHDLLDESSVLLRAWNNVKRNWATVFVGLIISILTSVLVGWAEFFAGAPE
ncbi:hypothetical protein [Frigidibacter oleivorans]|uniref:hypothetical protein n=1 Tax=Frigidibacter oleivorans TaxID=2487129 RepID=UPI000F8ECAD1|nr:hypothetical protein [Frigidibacter oleivorans]